MSASVMRPVLTLSMVLAAILGSAEARQTPAIDTSKIGPQVGTAVPAFSGTDQFGRTQTLDTIAGRDGAMLVFFRSADW